MDDADKLRAGFATRLLRLADRILCSFDQGGNHTITVDIIDYEDVIAASALAVRTNVAARTNEETSDGRLPDGS